MIAITSSNFYGFDEVHNWAKQNADVFRFTEENFKLRKAISPLLQTKVEKMLAWQLVPDYDYYIHIDASYEVMEGASDMLLQELGDNDLLVFLHPFNNTIAEEYCFMKERLDKSRYLQIRYQDELLDEQYRVITNDKEYEDDFLIHAAVYIYKNNKVMQNLMKEWWFNVSRYHLNDQLSFPYLIKKSGCKYKVMDKKISEFPYVKYKGHKK